MLSDMSYLTGRRSLSRKLLIVNFLGSVDMCTSGQNYRGGLLGFMEKKLKLRNSQKKCCTAPGGTRKTFNRVGKQTIKTFLSCYSFLNSRSAIFSPMSPCPMSAEATVAPVVTRLQVANNVASQRKPLWRLSVMAGIGAVIHARRQPIVAQIQ